MRSILVALTLLMSTASVVQAGECDDWRSAHPDWLWCDSFEQPDALRAYEDRRTTDENPVGMELSTAQSLEGRVSLRQHYEAGQVNAGWVIRVQDFPDDLFVRWYHLFPEGYTRYPPKMARIGFRDRSSWREVLRVHAWFQATGGGVALVADTLARDSSQANGSGWLPIAFSDHFVDAPANAGRWIAYEMQVRLNTPCRSDGLFRIWADGDLVIERTGVDLRGCESYGINEVMLDTYWNGGADADRDRFYDNLVISTGHIGLIAADNPPRPPELRVE